MNFLRTTFLMAAMTAIFLGAGYLLAGEGGLIIALVIAGGMNIFAYWNSDKLVLRMHHAREVDSKSAPEFVHMVHRLAGRAGLPHPKVYIIDNPQPNAFATGRNPENAAVAATTGLLKALKSDEVEGVMAHELAHIKNRDTLIMTITATIAGAIAMLANFALFFGGNRNNPLGLVGTILVMILAPLAAMLVQMAISRTREYSADKLGAQICGRPLSLASALNRISSGTKMTVNEDAERNPATAHLFIANPLSGRSFDSLFSTHPPMPERIRRLETLAGNMSAGGGFANRNTSKTRRYYSDIPTSGRADDSTDQKKGPWG